MKRLLVSAIAVVLLVSAGTSRAAEPEEQPSEPAPRVAALNLDFGTLPTGWEAARNPDGELRGNTNIVTNSDEDGRIIVISDTKSGKTLKEIADSFVTINKARGLKITDAVKDKDGNMTAEVTLVKAGKEVGKGFAIFRTFAKDPEGVYLFMGMWPNTAKPATAKQARAIALCAKLK